MWKIGEFARICHVTRRTLRFYDEEGLLCPDIVDQKTGYRYYSPDKIELLRRIQAYKDAGFTLDEIRMLLESDPECRNSLVAAKRKEMYEKVRGLQAKLSLLDALSDERKRPGRVDAYWLHKNFEDHPEIIGRWELCGRLMHPAYGEPPLSADCLEPCLREDVFQKLILLPRGLPWWAFCWSRGFLYQFSSLYQAFIPHPYTLWEEGGVRYMTVRYTPLSFLDHGGDPIWLLYGQTEHVALTERETRIFVDDVDLPLIPDPDVVGEWEAVAYVSDPFSFTHGEIPRTKPPFWVTGLIFGPDHTCIRRCVKTKGITERINRYTRYEIVSDTARGAVLGQELHTADEYLLREIVGEPFLFVQHKTGDYVYGGLPPKWHVFQRK